MTGPFARFLKDDTQTPTVTQQGGKFDRFLKPDTPPATPPDKLGFFQWMGNFASGWAAESMVSDKMKMEQMHIPVSYDPSERVIRDQIVKGQAIKHADFGNVFGQMFKDTKAQLVKVVSNPGELIDQVKKDPVGTVGQFGKAFLTPLTDLAELDSGISLTGDDFHALTPNEKTDRIKNVVATGAMMATGAAAAKAFKAAEEVGSVSRLLPKGDLARKALKGTIEAGAGGSAYGLVRHINEPDQLSETLINGVMFAPLGAAFELLHKGEPTEVQAKQTPTKTAHQLSEIRQLGADDLSFKGVMNTVDAMSTADDLSEAVVKSHIANGEPFVHLTGMPMDAAGKLAVHIPETHEMAHALEKDGTSSILVYDKKYAPFIDKRFFGENGFAENQIVSHDGRNMVVTGGDGKSLDLTNQLDPSDRVTVDKGSVRKPTRFTLNVQAKPELYDDWKKEAFVKQPSPIEQLQTKRSQLAKNPGPELDLVEEQLRRLEEKTNDRLDPIGFDDMPPESILDETNGRNLSAHIDSFLEKQNVDPTFRESYKKQLEMRLRGEAIAQLDPEDQAFIANADKAAFEAKATETLLDKLPSKGKVKYQYDPNEKSPQGGTVTFDNAADAKRWNELNKLPGWRKVSEPDVAVKSTKKPAKIESKLSVEDLTKKAKSNNMTISDGGSGRVIVRDNTGKILSGFDNYDDAATFIDKTGQASGSNMDGGPISGDAIGGGRGLPPFSDGGEEGDFPYKYNNPNGSKWEFIVKGLDNLRSITRIRDFISNVDTRNTTNLYARSVEPLQRLLGARNAEMTPWIERIGKIEESTIRKLSKADREKVGEWLQTMTPQQVINRFMSRPMNDVEQALGRQIADTKVDLEQIFPFIREMDQLQKEFGGNDSPESQREYANRVQQAREAFGIGDREMGVIGVINTVKSMNKREASLGAIVRLSRSITDGELDRGAFAKKHNLTSAQLKAGQELESLYQDLGDTFGIPKEARLGGYMTHARLYTNGDMSEAMSHFSGDVKARDFYAKLARTGELSASEKDPIHAAYRYVKGGFDEKSGLNQAIASAKNNVREQIPKLEGREQARVAETMDRFFDNVRGFPAAEDSFAQAAVDHIFDRFNFSKEIRSQWVNGLLTITNAAMTGLRPIVGIKHFVSALVVSEADRGHGYTSRVLSQGAYAKAHPEIIEEIRSHGGISTISPLFQYSKAEYEQTRTMSGKATRAAMNVNKFMFRATGTPDIFEMFSAGHFLTAKADALKALTEFGRNAKTPASWDKVRKATFLDKFNAPVAKQFVSLVKAGETESAANLLARETVNDLVGVFGDASQPVKWGTNWGRILGQYGNIPLWFRSTVARGLSRGTVGQRIAFGAKLGAAAWATDELSKKTGIDLSGLNPIKMLTYSGGPLVGLALDAANAMKGTGYTRQSAIRRLQKNLPIDPRTGRLQQSPFIPGSYAAQEIMKAAQSFEQGNPLQGIAQGLGFSIRR